MKAELLLGRMYVWLLIVQSLTALKAKSVTTAGATATIVIDRTSNQATSQTNFSAVHVSSKQLNRQARKQEPMSQHVEVSFII